MNVQMTHDSIAAKAWKPKFLKTQNVAGVAGCSGSAFSAFYPLTPMVSLILEGFCSGVAGVAAFF